MFCLAYVCLFSLSSSEESKFHFSPDQTWLQISSLGKAEAPETMTEALKGSSGLTVHCSRSWLNWIDCLKESLRWPPTTRTELPSWVKLG